MAKQILLKPINKELLDPPTVYYEQIHKEVNGRQGIFIDEPTIANCCGPKGAGKSLTEAYLGVAAMAEGINCWANFPIEFYLEKDGKREFKKSFKVDLTQLMTDSSPMHDGVVILDEYQNIAPSYSYRSQKNIILDALWAQVRKKRMSFYYSTKSFPWADTHLRTEADYIIWCEDLYYAEDDGRYPRKGEKFMWSVYTPVKNPFSQYWEITAEVDFYGKPFWKAYDTNLEFDIWETWRGVKVDLEKTTITDKEITDVGDGELMRKQIEDLFAQKEVWPQTQFWVALKAFSQKQKQECYGIFNELGVEPTTARGTRVFKRALSMVA